MSLLFNLLWMILGGGLLLAIEYAVAGALLCLTVIGIPFGVQCFKIAALALVPFGKELDSRPSLLGFPFNVLWFLFAGVWIFLTHLAFAIPLAVSLIGIPFALQHLKLGVLALAPFGAVVTPKR